MCEENTVKNYYNNDVLREWQRIDRHPVEFELNMRYIKKFVKPGSKILDIGGGPGRYSFWLAEMGCDVTLLDLSQNEINFAEEKSRELNLKIRTVCGDARSADKIIKNENFDLILLMGPLYHLSSEQDRIKSVRAALNLLKFNGILCAAFVSSYAAMWDYFIRFPEIILNSEEKKYFDLFISGEDYSGVAFADNYFINYKNIEKFMSQFNLEKLHVLSSESFLVLREPELLNQPREILNAWLDFAEKVCEREDILSLAQHLLYIGRKI